MGREQPKKEVHLGVEEKQQLEAIGGSRFLPSGLVRRGLVLPSASGMTDPAFAEKIGISNWMVGFRRKRYIERGLGGLYHEYRPGNPRTIEDDDVADLLQKTLASKPTNGTHWTCGSLAEETGILQSTVQRIWNAFRPPEAWPTFRSYFRNVTIAPAHKWFFAQSLCWAENIILGISGICPGLSFPPASISGKTPHFWTDTI